MTKVLHVIPSLSYGGAERSLFLLATTQRTSYPGPQSRIATLFEPTGFADQVRKSGISVDGLGCERRHGFLSAILKLRRIIQDWQPDAVQSWLYYGDLAATLALQASGRRQQTRLYWGVRNAYRDRKSMSAGSRSAEFLCARLSHMPDLIIANSHAGMEVHARNGYAPNKMAYIANGVDTELFKPCPNAKQALRLELGLQADARIVLHVGRVNPVKNHALMLEIAAKMPGTNFIAVGKETEKLVGPSNFKGLGVHSDLRAFYSAADLLLITSHNEGFPNVAAESMACGTPVAATPCGDAALVIGQSGFVLDSFIPDRFACVLQSYLARPLDHRLELGQSARERIISQFSLEKFVESFDSLHRTGKISISSGKNDGS